MKERNKNNNQNKTRKSSQATKEHTHTHKLKHHKRIRLDEIRVHKTKNKRILLFGAFTYWKQRVKKSAHMPRKNSKSILNAKKDCINAYL